LAIVDDFFNHGLSNRLRDRAMDLAVHDQRIDNFSGIDNTDKAFNGELTGFRVDFDFAGMAPIWKTRRCRHEGFIGLKRCPPGFSVGGNF